MITLREWAEKHGKTPQSAYRHVPRLPVKKLYGRLCIDEDVPWPTDKRAHSEATKRRAIQMLKDGVPKAAIAQELGVTRPTIYKWGKECGLI